MNRLVLIFLRDLIFTQAEMPLSSLDRPAVVESQLLLRSVPHSSLFLVLFLMLSVLLLLGVTQTWDSPKELCIALKDGMHNISEGSKSFFSIIL